MNPHHRRLAAVAAVVMLLGAMNTPAALASQEAQPPPAATAGPAPQAESAAAAKPRRTPELKPYEEAPVPGSPSSGAASPSGRSRSFTCCSQRSSSPSPSAFIVEAIGYKTGDRRPARVRFTELSRSRSRSRDIRRGT